MLCVYLGIRLYYLTINIEMTKKELTQSFTNGQSSLPDEFDQVDKELIKAACEHIDDKDWEQLDDRTIELLGKHLLSKEDKKNLHFDVDNFLDQMDDSK